MCGIVAYVGNRRAFPILIKGLQRLEYRGYDSAGVGIVSEDHNTITTYKQAGKVSDLLEYISDNDTNGSIGIGHTRWQHIALQISIIQNPINIILEK